MLFFMAQPLVVMVKGVIFPRIWDHPGTPSYAFCDVCLGWLGIPLRKGERCPGEGDLATTAMSFGLRCSPGRVLLFRTPFHAKCLVICFGLVGLTLLS